jgi:hypothetical protein
MKQDKEAILAAKENALAAEEKRLSDLELALDRRSRLFQTDKDVFDRKVTNWQNVDDARREAINKRVELGVEIGKLEARKELLEQVNVQKDAIIGMKDAEISTLKALLSLTGGPRQIII